MVIIGCNQPKDYFIGDEAISKKSSLKVVRPAVQSGQFMNEEDMTRIWQHTFYSELRVAPDDHPVIMGESVGNPKEKRELATEVMFETFCVAGYYVEQKLIFIVC